MAVVANDLFTDDSFVVRIFIFSDIYELWLNLLSHTEFFVSD